jgi:hypothetical protein
MGHNSLKGGHNYGRPGVHRSHVTATAPLPASGDRLCGSKKTDAFLAVKMVASLERPTAASEGEHRKWHGYGQVDSNLNKG